MSAQSLKPGWKMVNKFGEVVKNANLVEREPEANADCERSSNQSWQRMGEHT